MLYKINNVSTPGEYRRGEPSLVPALARHWLALYWPFSDLIHQRQHSAQIFPPPGVWHGDHKIGKLHFSLNLADEEDGVDSGIRINLDTPGPTRIQLFPERLMPDRRIDMSLNHLPAGDEYMPHKTVNERNAGALEQWLKLPAWKVRDRGANPTAAFGFQGNKMFLPRSLVKIQYCGGSSVIER